MKPILKTYSAVAFGLTGFVIAVSLGSILTWGTGIPLIGGLANGILVSMVLAIGMLAINSLYTGTIMWFVFSCCAVFTTTLGPPGVYKIIIGLIAGIIWDIIYFTLFRKKVIGLFIGAVIAALLIMFLMLGALYLGFGRGAEEALKKYLSALYGLVAINMFVTILGVSLGHRLYVYRLSKLKLFQDLR